MKIMIDKQEIEAYPEETIMDAARRNGVFIPGLCWDEAVEKTNCCRLCMVETTDGSRKKLVAACAFRVKEGLRVDTDSERVQRIRKTLLRLMYTQAPDNPTIMELMRLCHVTPHPALPLKADSRQCILCRLCVGSCQALGASSISPILRGIEKRIDTPYSKASETCIGCASCARICPTGCIDVEDTPEHRTIWNRQFEWIRCEQCGALITTKEHFAASTPPGTPALCPVCRRKAQAEVFAKTLGE